MLSLISNKKFRIFVFLIVDILLIYLSGVLALLTRFEFLLQPLFLIYYNNYIALAPFFIFFTIVIFIIFSFYTTMWSLASIREASFICLACIISTVIHLIISVIFSISLPRSYYILYLFYIVLFVALSRFSYRFYKIIFNKKLVNPKRVMIVGAGEAGVALLRELKNSQFSNSKVILFVDDNPYKFGKNINGIRVYGDRNNIVKFANEFAIDEIYIALPSVSQIERSKIASIANESNCKVKILPGIYQLVNGEVSISKLRDIQLEDLLGRDEVKINNDDIFKFVENKKILVTGAGGSIGSELCRQIAAKNPKELILLDIYENTIYDLQNELKFNFPNLNLITLIASVRNYSRLEEIFKIYNPNVVFHAAAHKHVPLMEKSPCEAIKNNCLGTLNLCNISNKYNVSKFILISTDKAVNPTNIMGASKRICEMIIQYMSKNSNTTFSAVRFGNVLGSNGSVVPLFKQQIENGGPITITDPNIIRYFMTIPEAVSLVLQAAVYAKGSEIFVLDMGEPVKIEDMARKLIKLSGYIPDVDIQIKYIGLRPGEKLYEELLMNEEGMQKTENNRIFIGKQIEFDENSFMTKLNDLIDSANSEDANIKYKVKNIVDTYKIDEKGDIYV